MEKSGTLTVKSGLAEMLKGGVIMDVTTADQAKIAEDAGAVSVMALERVPADIRAEGFDPPLTATQSSIGAAGKRVVELLIRQLRNPGEALPTEVWPVDLVVRASTGPGPAP